MITAEGHSGTVIFDGRTITIRRTGFLARMTVGKGEKQIPLTSVQAVQWKPAGALMNGFIEFSIAGGVERRSEFGRQTRDAGRNENAVIFTKQQMSTFQHLRDEIEKARRVMEDMRYAPPRQTAPSMAEELANLGVLRQQGILSEAEFEAAKARLIGR